MEVEQAILMLVSPGVRVAVVGLGVSGVETARFLLRRGALPVCFERRDRESFFKLSPFAGAVDELVLSGAEVHFGIEGAAVAPFVADVVAVVLSPGVPLEGSTVRFFSERGIPVIGEFELGVELSGVPTTIVTGSNGKSTTVSLIHAAWEEAGKRARLCGNVGTPVIAGLCDGSVWDLLVGEASSYQLESCSVLRPDVGIFLNLTENHLERHGTIERYREAKLRLFQRHSSSHVAVLNYDDPFVRGAADQLSSSLVWFGRTIPAGARGVTIAYDPARGVDELQYRFSDNEGTLSLRYAPLIGVHHRYNLAAALSAFLVKGGPISAFERMVREFQGLPHRTQLVGEWSGRVVINDSKSTTVAATVAALMSAISDYPDHSVTLFIGGLVKVGSWDPLFTAIRREQAQRPVRVICFGKDGPLLEEYALRSGLRVGRCATMADAVSSLPQSSSEREVILFSPGAASFDEFRDFEDRGDTFCSAIRRHFG